MGTSEYQFTSSDADAILLSSDAKEFHVHRCILSVASPFFRDMFALPQSSDTSQATPTIPVSENSTTLDALLRFVYPLEQPIPNSLDDLVPILDAAIKYDLTSVICALRKLLIAPRFVKKQPTRVYAIACRFELEEEAKVASKHTLDIQVLDVPLCDDLKFITAHSYHRLLDLHHQRAEAVLKVLSMKLSDHVRCMQCNGSIYSANIVPKWWHAYEKLAKEELRVRPTSRVIFELDFLASVSIASECPRCAGSILDAWKWLGELKAAIDALPSTI